VSGNQLTSLPEEINQQRKLERLDLSNNQFKSLTDQINSLSNNEPFKLDLRGNPMEPAEIDKVRRWLPKAKILFDM
jgi:Leucine-rich repeat (LRR) protein